MTRVMLKHNYQTLGTMHVLIQMKDLGGVWTEHEKFYITYIASQTFPSNFVVTKIRKQTFVESRSQGPRQDSTSGLSDQELQVCLLFR